MRMFNPKALLLLFALAPITAMADDALAHQRIVALFDNLKTLQAEFSQTVLDSELNVVRETSGTLQLSRPGKFRWEYAAPFAQIIVADGLNLWTYDPDLEQATVKPLENSLASSPAAVFTGDAPLDENFTVREMGQAGVLYWVALIPKVHDGDFESIRIGLENNQLATMELRDSLGQITRIIFRNVVRNPSLAPETFVFTPPTGADVIGEAVQ